MAGIDAGGGRGRRRAVDHPISLVPFIDLLLCCVMFLLVTAVWNELASVEARQHRRGAQAQDTPMSEIQLILEVHEDGYVLGSTAGTRVQIPKRGEVYDQEELRTRLQQRKRLEPNRRDVVVVPEDGVVYRHVIAAMDVLVGEGFEELSFSEPVTL